MSFKSGNLSLFSSLTRAVARTAVLTALSVRVLDSTAGAAPATSTQPNFLVILADDLGARELGCYGHPTHKTPNLDRLASEGTRFQMAYATPLCTPTRVELMTGRYAFRTGWYSLIGRPYTPKEGTPEYDLGNREITFADILKQRGYVTAMAGKWQLPGELPTLIHDCGFDEYCMWAYTHNLPPGAKYKGKQSGDRTERYWHPSIVRNGKFLPTKPNDYGPDIHTNFLLDFMARNTDRPFLAYYPALQTHSPWDETPDPARPGARKPRGFESNLEYLDHLVGRLVTGLEKTGQRKNTVIIFIGDNGTEGAGKSTTTELGARVPLIVNCPGIVKSGVVSEALVDASDVMPTLAEFAGASLPSDRPIDGKSFAGVLQGKTTGTREWIFSSLKNERILRTRRWLREGDGKFFDCGNSLDGTGYVDVTNSTSPEVLAARSHFDKILEKMPAPPAIARPDVASDETSATSNRANPDRAARRAARRATRTTAAVTTATR